LDARDVRQNCPVLVFLVAASGYSSASAITTAGLEQDPTFGPFEFINNTGGIVYDLETVWTGTGGTLANGVITLDTGPAAMINASSNMVTVTWAAGLMNGGAVAFTMDGSFEAVFSSGNWTNSTGGVVAPANPTPEPSSVFLLGPALIGIVLTRIYTQRLPSRVIERS
jgi:hypothetical protein